MLQIKVYKNSKYLFCIRLSGGKPFRNTSRILKAPALYILTSLVCQDSFVKKYIFYTHTQTFFEGKGNKK